MKVNVVYLVSLAINIIFTLTIYWLAGFELAALLNLATISALLDGVKSHYDKQ